MPRRPGTGCIPCKLRRKKCDERKPTCMACARNVLLCAWHSESHTSRPHNSDDRGSRTRQQPTRLAPASERATPENWAIRAAPALHPQLANEKTNFLYSFFYSTAAQALSIKDRLDNPFIYVLMPMAAASDIVFQAMIAFSGVIYQQQHSACFAQTTWGHYAQAIRSLKHALTLYVEHQADRATELLATVLLLLSLEVSKTDSDGHAFCHLQACRELVSGAFAHCRDSQMLGFLVEYYLYTLSLLPTSSMESPELIEEDIEFAFQTLLNNAVPATGVLCGCAPRMFRTIPKVTEISRRLHDEFTIEGGSSVQTLHERHILYNFIQSWLPEGADEENATIARIYQKALLVLLSQADPGTSDNPEMEVLVANIVSLLRKIPVQSSTTTILAWPLATVAPCVKSPTDRAFILRYLGAVVQKYGFENHRQSERLLQLIWSRQDLQRQGPYCIPRAMEEHGFRFLLC
ncbi:transcriptional regulator family: Fungal Specific TF [Penicillium roqueforti]|nr:transcriptional regulator family: Fungal Specific TF [Penicillium roqueforti]KAI3260530.1 transcriptional regulator family: Fungal Specific TF [Penicillium roqueforti]KAI3275596.1 transcriptional regulator family: Fungal Specific TF [Penicillium roqueforti]